MNRRNRIKLYLVLAATLFGWLQTVTHWPDVLQPQAIGGLGILLIASLSGALGINSGTAPEKDIEQ